MTPTSRNPIHKTADGHFILLSKMSDSHLENTMLMIKRHAHSGVKVIRGGGHDDGDMWYDEDILYGQEALDQLGFKYYQEEYAKRKLSKR